MPAILKDKNSVTNSMLNYVCPNCHHPISNKNSPVCNNCKTKWEIQNDIIHFVNDAPIWHLYSNDEFEKILNKCNKLGWQKALRKIQDTDRFNWILGTQRIDGIFNTNITPDTVALDVGSGWGGMSIHIAKMVKEVHCIDNGSQGLRFINLRAEQAGLKNIKTSLSNAHSLPYPANSFDLVILSGILEFTPSALPSLTPCDAQLKVLKECNRVLKSSGQLYLAIENRYSFLYLLGNKDEHTGLRWVPMLPRTLANWYHKLFLKTPYRHWIYSYWELKNLLKEAEFGYAQITSPYRTYRHVDNILDLESPDILKIWFKHSIYPQAKRIKKCIMFCIGIVIHFATCFPSLLKWFPPCFFAVASQNKSSSLLQDIAKELPGFEKTKARFLIYGRSRSTLAIVFPPTSKIPKFILRIDRGNGSSKRIYSFLNDFYPSCKTLQANIPKPLLCKQLGSSHIVALSALNGKKVDPHKCDIPHHLDQVIDFLITLFKNTKKTYNVPDFFQIEQFKKNDLSHSLISKSTQIGQIAHGDFAPGNIMIKDKKLLVIDWEMVGYYPKMFDWFYYLTLFFQLRYSLNYKTGESPVKIWSRIFFDETSEKKIIMEMTKKYTNAMLLQDDEIPQLLKIFFIISYPRFSFLKNSSNNYSHDIQSLICNKNIWEPH